MEVVKLNLEGTASAPITFRCSCCEIVLRVRQGVAQTTGPCPVCGTINSCSGLGAPPESRVVVTAAEMPSPLPSVSLEAAAG
jgi:phage FluMu protein Com